MQGIIGEIGPALAWFFLNPLTYIMIAAMLMIGYLRVKRERKMFYAKMYPMLMELTMSVIPAIVIAAFVSVITIVTGISLPLGAVLLAMVISALLAVSGLHRWLTALHVWGTAFLAALALDAAGVAVPFFSAGAWLGNGFDAFSLMVWIAVLTLAEGILIVWNGTRFFSPLRTVSRRGKPIGGQITHRLWMLPVFLFIPGSAVEAGGWWPLLPGGTAFSLLLLPVVIGIRMKTFDRLAAVQVRSAGWWVVRIAVLAGAGAALAYFYSGWIIPVITAVLILLREWVTIAASSSAKSNFLYTLRGDGISVLAVLPESPADRMHIKAGEVIRRVNSEKVYDEASLYRAVQKNSAYCRLDVEDINGELRQAQAALYSNQHHQLGILMINKERTAPESMHTAQ
ncbi:PDZ domain-containing protein [Marinococcus halotolerans]|uniref:PDZ domain-containing protein n=1 Tax=Marinococcus halotolerans TaxID=301092 RepID=UPI0003B4A702|nr:PDZ domain-containing protein [Marinococcus halotolerans]